MQKFLEFFYHLIWENMELELFPSIWTSKSQVQDNLELV